jgi:DNA-binding GntR family transcriptional regulator
MTVVGKHREQELAGVTEQQDLQVFDAPQVRVLSDEVTLAIEKAIFLGTVVPGQRLVESDIARQMGISKAPVREALRALETLGLVVSNPRRCTFVTSPSATLASEAFSLRALMECYAIRIALPRLTEDHFAAMAEFDRRSDASYEDYPMQIEYDLRVHDLLFEVAGHRLLTGAWANLRSQIRLLLIVSGALRRTDPDLPWPKTVAQAHAPLVAALRAGDGEGAEDALIAHLAEGERRLLAKLAPQRATPYVRKEVFARQRELIAQPAT